MTKLSLAKVLPLSLLLLVSVSAQQPASATFRGRLVDPNGEPVGNTGSSITAKNTATGAEFSAAIAANGDFLVTSIPPGTYDVSVPIRSAMYRSYSQKSVALKAGENKIDLHIEWAINLGTIGDDPFTLANDIRARNPVQPGPAPRLANGKPDLNGLWIRVVEPPGPPNPYPYQAWAADVQKKLQARPGGVTLPHVYCLPFTAIPFDLYFLQKIVQTPQLIVTLAEFDTPGYRQIFLDGRPHPKTWNPAWLGHSVGRWEGDTLVVDTVGFNEAASGVGVHSEKLHVVERIQRPDKSHLTVSMTLDDADAWTKPWTTTAKWQLAPNEEILEFICAENNVDPSHLATPLKYSHRP
jgi:hypothetical protein